MSEQNNPEPAVNKIRDIQKEAMYAIRCSSSSFFWQETWMLSPPICEVLNLPHKLVLTKVLLLACYHATVQKVLLVAGLVGSILTLLAC